MVNDLLKLRVLTALAGIPLLVAIINLGGYYLLLSVLAVVLLALDELFHAFENFTSRGVIKTVGYFSGILFILGAFYYDGVLIAETLFVVAALNLLYYVFAFPKVEFWEIGLTILSAIYVGYFLSFILLLRNLPQGEFFLLLAFILTWSTDIGAYSFGMLFGRTKLSQNLSPKKTVEGAFGGLVFPLAAVYSAFLLVPVEVSLIKVLGLGLAAGIIGQVGDLVASAIKRQAGIKDFGNILPGHGGFLDRFDSFILVAPLVYYYLRMFIID